jgi:hypothetical protein
MGIRLKDAGFLNLWARSRVAALDAEIARDVADADARRTTSSSVSEKYRKSIVFCCIRG